MKKKLFPQIIIPFVLGLGFHQNAFASDELQEKIQRLTQKINKNAQKIYRLNQEQMQQQQKLVAANQRLKKSYPSLLKTINSNHASLFEKITYPVKEPKEHFYPMIQFETADHKNSLSIKPLLSLNSDIFADTKGLLINTGANVEPVLKNNTVIRNWLDSAGFIMQSTINENTHFVMSPQFARNQTYLDIGHVSLEQLKLFSLRAGFQTSLVAGLGFLLPNYATYPGFTTNMAPTRENGVVWYGFLGESYDTEFSESNYLGYNHRFSYQFGVFNGTSDGAFPGLNPLGPDGQGLFLPINAFAVNKSFEGRIFYNPFLGKKDHFFENLGIGIGASTQKPNAQSPLPFILTIGQNMMLGYATGQTFAVSSRTRYHPQLVWYKKQLGIYADWAQTTQNLTNTYPSPKLVPSWVVGQTNKASEIQVFYNLTGEEFTLGNLEPLEEFKLFQKNGGWGALQLFTRFTTFVADPSSFSKSFFRDEAHLQYWIADPRISVAKATGWSVGLNWFWNAYFKLRTEFAQTQFVGGCSTGAFNDPLSPGCLTAAPQFFMAPDSKLINRPNEYVAMESVSVSF